MNTDGMPVFSQAVTLGPKLQGFFVENSPSAFEKFLTSPLVASSVPIPIFILLAPLMLLLFKNTWRQFDIESQRERGHILAMGQWDARPAVACVIVAVVLTMQEYFGGAQVYVSTIQPWLRELDRGALHGWIQFGKYNSLYNYAWWSFTRIAGYVFFPLIAWKILFRKDSILDMGFRISGFVRHSWIYIASLFVVIPALLIVARQPDFGNYYPFYKQS
ncbi:MAG: hypothetical protein FWD57_11890, partial [Polyangiaceae bacterium]|nr:hypothetical protein [Polyangiaceae bacterium]